MPGTCLCRVSRAVRLVMHFVIIFKYFLLHVHKLVCFIVDLQLYTELSHMHIQVCMQYLCKYSNYSHIHTHTHARARTLTHNLLLLLLHQHQQQQQHQLQQQRLRCAALFHLARFFCFGLLGQPGSLLQVIS